MPSSPHVPLSHLATGPQNPLRASRLRGSRAPHARPTRTSRAPHLYLCLLCLYQRTAPYTRTHDQGGFRIPALLHDRLYPHQRWGVEWLWKLHSRHGIYSGSRTGCGRAASAGTLAPASASASASAAAAAASSTGASSEAITGGILADDMGLGKTFQVQQCSSAVVGGGGVWGLHARSEGVAAE